MEIKKVPISEVDVWKENPRNIKTEDFKRLKKQITELGVYKPLICYQENGKYITLGGNMRLRALRELNHQEIDISIIKPKTEAEKIKYALSDNDRMGQYDEQALAELTYPYIDEINLEDFKIDVGEPIDLKTIIEDFAPNLDGTEDEIPEIDDSPAITKMGDLFTLGKHRLLCGDATKEEDVKRLMNGQKADMVFTDPPYNIGYDYQSWDDNLPNYKKWCVFWFELLKKYSLGNIILTIGTMNIVMWYEIEPPLALGIWKKDNAHSGGKISKLNKWEPLLFYGQYKKRRDSDIFDYYVNSGFLREKEEATTLEEHSANKPVRLLVDLIKSYSEINNTWLDFFLGSGTTLIACEKLNRICYGMEIEPKYCDIIITRFSNFTNIPEEEIRATRENG